ncbi:hypothetical protein FGE12_02240 [Aggregicoccus sp. 17bor-14]|uniref:hypothetical protein n=1 Tax=Myxococcaceae TaxID=31 RepID=UPI00129D00DC|nr:MULTISPECIES: hypothetical protein [Myxococcaceae]MBF5041190.1 hypothetical protein [Simulacricoccus sp. 17bor-14]MRI86977.1 hypothetical protein [Aggregicoccus sp. 17bor-14]
MSFSCLEAYDLIRFAEVFETRLAGAEEQLSGKRGLVREKEWMGAALELVRLERIPAPGMLERVRDLPELDEVREEFGAELLNVWVDALEKLHAGITFSAGSRSPVIDALFPHLKFPQLRRASREAVTEYAALYERRLKSSYVTRLLAQDELALVRPVLDQVAAAYVQWLACYNPAPLPEDEAAPLREGLITLGRRLDIAVRQARLLAEAALTPVRDAFDASGLGIKPKRRPGRGGGPLELDAVHADDVEAGAAVGEDAAAEAQGEPPLEEGHEPPEEEGGAASAAEAEAVAEPVSEPVPEPSAPVEEEAAPTPKAARRRKKAAKPAEGAGD